MNSKLLKLITFIFWVLFLSGCENSEDKIQKTKKLNGLNLDDIIQNLVLDQKATHTAPGPITVKKGFEPCKLDSSKNFKFEANCIIYENENYLVNDNIDQNFNLKVIVQGSRSMIRYVQFQAFLPNRIHQALSGKNYQKEKLSCKQEIGSWEINKISLSGKKDFKIATDKSFGSGGEWGTLRIYLNGSDLDQICDELVYEQIQSRDELAVELTNTKKKEEPILKKENKSNASAEYYPETRPDPAYEVKRAELQRKEQTRTETFLSKYQALYTPKDFIKLIFENATDMKVYYDFENSRLFRDIMTMHSKGGIHASITCESIILMGVERYDKKKMKIVVSTKDIDILEVFSPDRLDKSDIKRIACKKSLDCAHQEGGREGYKPGDGLALILSDPYRGSVTYGDEFIKLHNDKNYDPSRLSNFPFSMQLSLLGSVRLSRNSGNVRPTTALDMIVRRQFIDFRKSCLP
jgi:hypothetical protein